MVELELGPHRVGDIAERLGRKVATVGPIRNIIIANGMPCSPANGDTAISVSLFDKSMRRIMLG
jgi:hypothetical protein